MVRQSLAPPPHMPLAVCPGVATGDVPYSTAGVAGVGEAGGASPSLAMRPAMAARRPRVAAGAHTSTTPRRWSTWEGKGGWQQHV